MDTKVYVQVNADFNADGKADILWRDTSGNLVVSLVNGATITATTFVASLP